MIKFAFRRNLIYPLQLLLWNNLRDIECYLISHFFRIDNFLLYTGLMFTGEISAGLIFLLYQYYFLKGATKEEKEEKIVGIEYIYTERIYYKKKDFKSFFLIMTSALSDFSQFFINLYLPKFMKISGSLEQRLRGNYTLHNALFYYFALKLPIFKHQSLSLIIITICLLIVVITEFIFQEFNIFLSYGQFIVILLILTFIQFCNALEESIEKYLYEDYKFSPFYVLMFQGIFGLIFYIIYCLFYNPFDEIIAFRQKKTNTEFSILIIGFIFYIILSGLKNSFRVITTKIYSPMTTTFMDYILNPFILIYYFAVGEDFISYGDRNYAYFFINLIISIIITFFGCVYNEFLILFCCGLQLNTHNQVTKRADIENELGIIQINEEQKRLDTIYSMNSTI